MTVKSIFLSKPFTFTSRQGILCLLVGGGGAEGSDQGRGQGLRGQVHHNRASLRIHDQRLSGLLEEGLGHTGEERTAAHYHIHSQQWWWLSKRLLDKGRMESVSYSVELHIYTGGFVFIGWKNRMSFSKEQINLHLKSPCDAKQVLLF